MLETGLFDDEKKEIEKSSENTKRLMFGLYGIVGITTISLTPYELQITKAPLFDWEEIEPQIIGLIQMVGAEVTGEEVKHIAKPIWEFQKWGLRADGTKTRARKEMEEMFDDDI